tara:strand:+ start:262 stop:510 length:249 start_codon:yes stop_codon:yes gene_type:complete
MIMPATIVSIKVKPFKLLFELVIEGVFFFLRFVFIGLKALKGVISTAPDCTTYTSSKTGKVFVFPVPSIIHFLYEFGWNGHS